MFLEARSNIDPFLYDDVQSCFEWIKNVQNMQVAILTNEIICLCPSSRLYPYTNISMRAADIGTAKPSLIPFIAICQRTGVNPSRILYIGNNYLNDVVSSKMSGMKAAYIRRTGRVVDLTYDEDFKNYQIIPYIEINNLEYSEILNKIKNLLSEDQLLSR